MKKSILLVLILILTVSAIPLFAKTYYEKGNSFFTMNAGVNFPSFISFPNDSSEGSHSWMKGTHIKMGGLGSLAYQGCISPIFALGGEIGYDFNFVVDGKIFTQVPITARATLIPVQTGKFDLNIVGNLGINFIKYNNIRNLVPYVSFALNPVLYVSNNWGIGLSTGLELCTEFSKNSSNNAVFGSMPIMLTVSYRK